VPAYFFSFLVSFFVSFFKNACCFELKICWLLDLVGDSDKLPHITLIDLMLKLLSQQIFTTVASTTCLALINFGSEHPG